jgi:hypothetical protein
MSTNPSRTHRDYAAAAPVWKRIRDVQSEDRVKLARTDYLPMLNSHTSGTRAATAAYESYLMRAQLHGAAGRTLDGLVGAVLRKEPAFEGVPEEAMAILRDAAGRNYEPIEHLIMRQVREVTSIGRCAVLVDKGEDPESEPYIVVIEAEDLLFWADEQIDGRDVPVLLVIREEYETQEDGDLIGSATQVRLQYRVLRLGRVEELPAHLEPFAGKFAGASGLVYWQEIWREDDQVHKFGMVDVMVPTRNGGRFWEEIPCDVVNARSGISLKVDEPPMAALAAVILSHYRNSADLEWGLHLTATPQPWAAGFDVPEGSELVTGCGYAWVTPTAGATVQYLEFGGAGLGSIVETMGRKEQQMALLGSRMLESQKNSAEAMGTVKLRQSGERSVLATIADNCAVATTRAVQRWLSWRSPAFDTDAAMASVKVSLGTDFDALPLDPAELQALTAALQAGTISWDTFAFNLRRGEMLPPGVTDEDERKRIQAGAPGRSRKEELAMLQTDAREGRITLPVYLDQIQQLGMLPGVSVDEILAEIDAAAAARAEAQMMALRIEEERAAAAGKPPADDQERPDAEAAA